MRRTGSGGSNARTPPARPRRPFYSPYPLTVVGCLFWPLVLFLVWILVGWLFAPAWWPYWR